MSLRMKSLFAAFGVSLALWGIVIKSAIILYPYATGPGETAPIWTAELGESGRTAPSVLR
ncbi:hypothetical protein [Rhizobium sp. CC-YZS058]|uniref:hypothetical protein n=1 Tax=Rhizobium sp. CC-YZS058 TaxID=3042153 RepID=UPI002B05BF0F|nr:hypothetical protein [Rhizobium sp. CC-YZS058]MEA3535468.1 hypothetical protein [Rhizobium sp. CC-YZS058]